MRSYNIGGLLQWKDYGSAVFTQAGNAIALPCSFLLDSNGRLRASLSGVAEWDTPEFKAAILTLLGEKQGAAAPAH